MDLAPLIFFCFMVVFMGSLPAYGLQRPWRGLGFAWLGAFLGAGLSIGMGLLYLAFVHVEARPRHDSDWSGVGVYLFWLFLAPCVGAIAGLVLGYRHAHRRERRASEGRNSALFEGGVKPMRSDPG